MFLAGVLTLAAAPGDAPSTQEEEFSLSGGLIAGGRPVGGAVVTMVSVVSPCDLGSEAAAAPAAAGPSAESDERGLFRFEGVAAGVYRLRVCPETGRCFDATPRALVSSEDLGPVVLRDRVASREAPARTDPPITVAVRTREDGLETLLRRPTGPVVRGVVRDEATGEPIPGAYVWADEDAGCYATTGPAGAFALGVPDPGYRLLAVAPGYLEGKAEAGAHAPARAGIALEPASGALRGTVRSWLGRPVPDALVLLPELRRWARSSEEGEFHVSRLPHPAEVGVRVTAEGFEEARARLPTALPPAHQGRARVILRSIYRVTGEVRDGADQPVAGVSVRVYGKTEMPPSLTDRDGLFSLPLPGAGNFGLQLEKPGFPRADLAAVVDAAAPKLDLGVVRLGGAVQVWGVVRTAEGEPLEGVEVFDTGVAGSAGRDEVSRRPRQAPLARTGEAGAFECVLERGGRQTTRLEFWKEGRAPAQEEISLHEPELPLLLYLEEAYELRGTVVDGAGAPVAGALVQLEGGRPPFTRDGTSRHLETDADGAFAVSGLTSGTFRLAVTRPGCAAEVREVREDPLEEDLELRIVLEPEAQVRGRVVDPAGRPVPTVVIRVMLPGRGFMAPGLLQTSDREGRFFLLSLPPGPARFELTRATPGPSSGFTRTYEDVVLLPGPQDLDLMWNPPGSGTGERRH